MSRSAVAGLTSVAGQRVIVATTRSDPTVGLIFYDLKHCLGSIDDAPPEPPAAPTRSRKKADSSA